MRATGDELALPSIQCLPFSFGLARHKARESDAYFDIISGNRVLLWDQSSGDYTDDYQISSS